MDVAIDNPLAENVAELPIQVGVDHLGGLVKGLKEADSDAIGVVLAVLATLPSMEALDCRQIGSMATSVSLSRGECGLRERC